MQNITGEVAVRSFFGGGFKNMKVQGKTVNEEIS